MLFYFLNGNPRRNNREHVLFLEDFKQIQGLTARALGSAAAWLPTARTTTPTAGWDDITEEDKAEAKRYGDLMGEKALGILSKK